MARNNENQSRSQQNQNNSKKKKQYEVLTNLRHCFWEVKQSSQNLDPFKLNIEMKET